MFIYTEDSALNFEKSRGHIFKTETMGWSTKNINFKVLKLFNNWKLDMIKTQRIKFPYCIVILFSH